MRIDRRFKPLRAFSIPELIVVVTIAAMLLALIVPALAAARAAARRDACAGNQRAIGTGWQEYLREKQEFPNSESGAGPWTYAGVAISPTTGRAALDFARPLNRFLDERWILPGGSSIFESPVDRGIKTANESAAGSMPSAYRSFGTSYRANDFLIRGDQPLAYAEVAAEPDRLVIMGPPFWYEEIHETSRSANWYGRANRGIVLFLDNSTRWITVSPGLFAGEDWTLHPGPVERNPNPSHQREPGD